MNKTANIIIGLVAGAAAGVVAGILVAPHKGSKTRKIIKKRTRDITDEISKSVLDKMESIERKLNALRHQVENGIDEKAEETKHTAAQKVEKAARKVEAEAHKVAPN